MKRVRMYVMVVMSRRKIGDGGGKKDWNELGKRVDWGNGERGPRLISSEFFNFSSAFDLG